MNDVYYLAKNTCIQALNNSNCGNLEFYGSV